MNRSNAKFCARCRAALIAPISRCPSPLVILGGAVAISVFALIIFLILPRANNGSAANTTPLPVTVPAPTAVTKVAATLIPPTVAPDASTPLVRNGWTVGDQAPDFALSDLNGNTVRLSDLRGQVVVVNFWATWCGYCEQEMADLQSFHGDYHSKGAVVLALDQAEGRDEVQRFRDEHGLTFPVLLDDDEAVGNQYRVSGLPMTYIIDRAGIVRAVLAGQQTKQQFIDQTEPWM